MGGGGGLMQTRKCVQTREVLENFRFKSSEMAINASKTAKSNMDLQLFHLHLKHQVTTWPPR